MGGVDQNNVQWRRKGYLVGEAKLVVLVKDTACERPRPLISGKLAFGYTLFKTKQKLQWHDTTIGAIQISMTRIMRGQRHKMASTGTYLSTYIKEGG